MDEADVELGRLNLIIGLQSSGKSCVMVIACYCSWVEKRIALRQSPSEFEAKGLFMERLVSYYHIKGYVKSNTKIEYETEFMRFAYDNETHTFEHRWKNLHWRYKRPKVSYVPAERNMVSLISNWSKLATSYENILDFKVDWDVARAFMEKEVNILGLGITYKYDAAEQTDTIITLDGQPIEMMNGSSGVQSLVPQYVLLDYLCQGIYQAETEKRGRTLSEKNMAHNLLELLYKKNSRRFPQDYMGNETNIVSGIEGKDFIFPTEKEANKFKKEAGYLLYTDHAEVFLEEPESNLFPTTQCHLMDWIAEAATNKKRRHFFFIATHSPYVLDHLIHENIDDFRLFLTKSRGNGLYSVKTASEEEMQQVFDNGSDAFFNIDTLAN